MNNIEITDYFSFRIKLRKYNIENVIELLKHSTEKYFDTETNRNIIVGKHKNKLVLIPYEEDGDNVIPITIHATSRQQIKFRLTTGRFI